MALLAGWLIFPAVLGALSLGCGVLVERLTGIRIPGTLLLPVGFAVIVCAAQLAVTTDATAELAAPLVVALALAGAAFYRSFPDRRPDVWAIGAAVAVFAAFAAPVVLSGKATFAGFQRLDDISVWLPMTDHVMSHGRDYGSLATSFYKGLLRSYLSSGYPIGAFLPLGVGQRLTGQDVAWVFQPYLAFLAAMLALSLYELASRVIDSPRLRALVVFIAAQPAILFGYALVGGVKEMVTAALLAPLAVLGVAAAKRRTIGVRELVPLAFVTAALFEVVSYGAVFWVLPLLAPALWVALRAEGNVLALRRAGTLVLLTAAIALPALPAMLDFVGDSRNVLTSGGELGSLVKSLSPLQPFGIWPTGDFRLNPSNLFITDVLIALVVAGGVAALVFAWRRKAWELPAYSVGSGVGCLAIALFGAPWVDAKSFAVASPALLLAGVVGVAAAGVSLFKGRPLVRIDLLGPRSITGPALLAGAVGALIAFGVLWSNVLAYHDVNLAPRDRFAELEKIGELTDGKGRTLSLQYDLYDVTYFLRKGDPEGPWRVPLVDGTRLRANRYADVDEFEPAGVLGFRSLVIARSPIASRPPSQYRLAWRGDYYDLWQRSATPGDRILGRLPLGDPGKRMPIAKPKCRRLRVLARIPGTRRLAAVSGSPTLIVRLGQLEHPDDWDTVPDDPDAIVPRGPGKMTFRFRLGGTTSPYHFWVGRSFRRSLSLAVDGRRIDERANELHAVTQFTPFGTASLGPGLHTVTLSYGGRSLAPGAGGTPAPFGPLVISQGALEHQVGAVRPRQVGQLCDETLDWVEALGS